MEKILASKKSRRYFYITIISLLVSLFVIRAFAIPYYFAQESYSLGEAVKTICQNLFVSLLVTVFIGSFLFWLYGSKPEDKMEIIDASEITQKLKELSVGTNTWFFSGGAGRYTRAITLPILAENAKEDGNKSIELQVIDPNNEFLCGKYAEFRGAQKEAKGQDFWTIENVRCQIISTIVMACYWGKKQTSLKVSIFLRNHFTIFRVDLADNGVMITRENAKANALFFPKGTQHYKSFRVNYLELSKQYEEINLANMVELPQMPDKINVTTVLQIIEKLHIFAELTDSQKKKVCQYCIEPEKDWAKLKV